MPLPLLFLLPNLKRVTGHAKERCSEELHLSLAKRGGKRCGIGLVERATKNEGLWPGLVWSGLVVAVAVLGNFANLSVYNRQSVV